MFASAIEQIYCIVLH